MSRRIAWHLKSCIERSLWQLKKNECEGGQDWKHEVPEVKRQLTADKAKNDLEQVNASVPVFSSLK